MQTPFLVRTVLVDDPSCPVERSHPLDYLARSHRLGENDVDGMRESTWQSSPELPTMAPRYRATLTRVLSLGAGAVGVFLPDAHFQSLSVAKHQNRRDLHELWVGLAQISRMCACRLSQEARHSEAIVQSFPPDPEAAAADRHRQSVKIS